MDKINFYICNKFLIKKKINDEEYLNLVAFCSSSGPR